MSTFKVLGAERSSNTNASFGNVVQKMKKMHPEERPVERPRGKYKHTPVELALMHAGIIFIEQTIQGPCMEKSCKIASHHGKISENSYPNFDNTS